MSEAHRSWLTVQKPTELPSGRDEYSKTYATGAGRYEAFVSSTPVHVRDSSGRWQEYDARFSRRRTVPWSANAAGSQRYVLLQARKA